MANKHKNRYPTTLSIRAMQIKTTVSHHSIPTRMADLGNN